MATAATSSTACIKPNRARLWIKRLGKVGLGFTVAMLLLWAAIHKIPWLGPALADGVRSVLGPKPVAWAENITYGIQDRFNRWRFRGAAPKTFWDVPIEPQPVVIASVDVPEREPPFAPPKVTIPEKSVATPADGVWIGMADRTGPDDQPRAFKTMIHPDKRRSFAALAVVALDTEAYDLHLVAGTKEPHSWSVPRTVRVGLVPDDHKAMLFAAFNGGFKTTHGSYAMRLGEHQFLTPRDLSCTFVRYATGKYAIGTWSDLKKRGDEISYYRQTPPCLVEGGKVHSMLHYHEYAKGWGATVSGDTVIRRSAIGLSKDKRVIYYGIGEAMTAQALARGMKAAGAHSAAELDVNYSYPRWLMYELVDPNQGPVATSALIPNIEFTKWQYVGQASPRDFFYVTRNRERAAMKPASDSKLALGD